MTQEVKESPTITALYHPGRIGTTSQPPSVRKQEISFSLHVHEFLLDKLERRQRSFRLFGFLCTCEGFLDTIFESTHYTS